MLFDHLKARGHRNIKALHRSTFEITRENFLTPRGDCIVAVSANKGLRDLDQRVKKHIIEGCYIAVIIDITDLSHLWDYSIGIGHQSLTLDDPIRIIVRKSSYISGNTLMIRSNKAAKDLNRNLVNALRDDNTRVDIYILVDYEYNKITRSIRDLGYKHRLFHG